MEGGPLRLSVSFLLGIRRRDRVPSLGHLSRSIFRKALGRWREREKDRVHRINLSLPHSQSTFVMYILSTYDNICLLLHRATIMTTLFVMIPPARTWLLACRDSSSTAAVR